MREEENRSTSGYSSVRMKITASRKHLSNTKDNTMLCVFYECKFIKYKAEKNGRWNKWMLWLVGLISPL